MVLLNLGVVFSHIYTTVLSLTTSTQCLMSLAVFLTLIIIDVDEKCKYPVIISRMPAVMAAPGCFKVYTTGVNCYVLQTHPNAYHY